MTTPSIEELISAYIDGELDSASAATVRNEIACSPRLQELERSLRELSGQLRRLPAIKPGRDLSASILEKLNPQLTPAANRTAREPAMASFQSAGRRSRTWLKVTAGAITSVAALILAMVLWNPQAFWGGGMVATSAVRPDSSNEKSGGAATEAPFSEEKSEVSGKGSGEFAPPSRQIASPGNGAGFQSLNAAEGSVESDGPDSNPKTADLELGMKLVQGKTQPGLGGIDAETGEMKKTGSEDPMARSKEGGKFYMPDAGPEKSAVVRLPNEALKADLADHANDLPTDMSRLNQLGSTVQDKTDALPNMDRSRDEQSQLGAGVALDQTIEKDGPTNPGSQTAGQIMVADNSESQRAEMRSFSIAESGGGSGFGVPGPGNGGDSKATSNVFAITIPAPGKSWKRVREVLTGQKDEIQSAPADRNGFEVFVFEGTIPEWDAMIQKVGSAGKDIAISLIEHPKPEQEKQLLLFFRSQDESGRKIVRAQTRDSGQPDLAMGFEQENQAAPKERVAGLQFLGRYGDTAADETAPNNRDREAEKLARDRRYSRGGGNDPTAGMGGGEESGASGAAAAGAGGGGLGGAFGNRGGRSELAESKEKSVESVLQELLRESKPQLVVGPNNEPVVRRYLILSVASEQSLAMPNAIDDN